VAEGLIPRAQRHEVTTLYLTLMAQAIFRRSWARAARSLGNALVSGWSPAAAPAWGWFFRAAFGALLRMARDRRTRPMPHTQNLGALLSDRQPKR
jgi:hypothetical protein